MNKNSSLKKLVSLLVACFFVPVVFASEVPDLTRTDVRIRMNPKTGKPFVSIVNGDAPDSRRIFYGNMKKYSRPDYRMLDYHMKSGQIPYDGPSSSAKKVYAFAATMATAGVLAGTLIPVTAAAGAASAGSAAGYGAAGTGLTAGVVSTAWLKSRTDPHQDDFKHDSEAVVKK
ncbi:MAG: hypothetical protein EXS63_03025 [Candidatus Omnitrophica bacterium]|nr:hypothetical protein [Candidatus Omnitrophota bacterium]